MKKLFLLGLLVFLSLACLLEPNDFPPRPPEMTVIVEFPPATPAPPTPTPAAQFIGSDEMSAAETFFLILKTSAAAGDSARIAESVYYPINVKIDGQMTTLHNADEFAKHYAQVFDQAMLEAILNTSEADLSNLPGGIRVGNGELWFGLFCLDPACAEPVFLITQINN